MVDSILHIDLNISFFRKNRYTLDIDPTLPFFFLFGLHSKRNKKKNMKKNVKSEKQNKNE